MLFCDNHMYTNHGSRSIHITPAAACACSATSLVQEPDCCRHVHNLPCPWYDRRLLQAHMSCVRAIDCCAHSNEYVWDNRQPCQYTLGHKHVAHSQSGMNCARTRKLMQTQVADSPPPATYTSLLQVAPPRTCMQINQSLSKRHASAHASHCLPAPSC